MCSLVVLHIKLRASVNAWIYFIPLLLVFRACSKMMMSLPVSCISVKCENLSFLSGQADADTKAGPLALKCSVYLPLVVYLRTAPELSSTAEQLLFLLHILSRVSPRQVTRPLPRCPSRSPWQTLGSPASTGLQTAKRTARMATRPTALPTGRTDTTSEQLHTLEPQV